MTRRVNLCRFGGQHRGGREAAGALSCGPLLPGGCVGIDEGKPGSCRWSGPCSSVSGCLTILQITKHQGLSKLSCWNRCSKMSLSVFATCTFFCFFCASSSFMFLLHSPFLPPLRLPMDFLTLCPSARQQLKTVGVALSLRMAEHSSDLWLGFGSFVDKPVSPYINVHPSKINNPCR